MIGPGVQLGRWLSAGLTGLLWACAAAPEPWVVSWQRPYHDLSQEGRQVLASAREHSLQGELELAIKGLAGLIESNPTNLDSLALRQDLLVARFPQEAAAMGDSAIMQAQRDPTPTRMILAARLSADREQAKALLEQVLVMDPTCQDAHLGLACLALEGDGRYRWRGARESLERCIALDPGHLGARRLEAWMFSQEGNPAAPSALARWLRASAGDPRVRHTDRVAGALDLAALHLGADKPTRALEILEELQGEAHQRPRRLALLAVARMESGDRDGALWAVSAAIRADPSATLPRVQEALLLEQADPLLQAEAWDRVAEVAAGGSELTDLIQGLRAQVAGARRRRGMADE